MGCPSPIGRGDHPEGGVLNRRSKLCLALAVLAVAGAVALLIVPLHSKGANTVLYNNTFRNGNSCGSLLTHPSPTYPLLSSSIQEPRPGVTGPSDPCNAGRSTAWWEWAALAVAAMILTAAAVAPGGRVRDEDLAEV